MGTGARFVLIPLQLSAEGVGGRGIAFTFAGVAIVMAACALLTGRVVDRRGTTAPMLIGAAVSVVLLLGLSRTNTALSTALVAVSIGFGLQPTATAAILRLTAMSDRLGVDSGTSLSYVNLCWTGGYLVGSLTAGWVSQRASDAAAWVVLACVCAAAGALFAFTR
jgi:MFS family permease